MVEIKNECCDCAAPGYPCQGDSCPYRHVKHYYCDNCGDEVDELYVVDGEELCRDCLKKLPIVSLALLMMLIM